MKYSFKSAVLTLAALALVTASAQADVSYDRYASILREKPQSNSLFAKAGTDFLTYPFELLRWPTSKGFVFADKHHLMDKTIWFYEKSIDYGVTPRFDGVDLDFLRMARLKQHVPDATVQGWLSYWYGQYFAAGGKAGMERIAGTPLRAFTVFNYQDRPSEHFYGIGPDSSKGDGGVYQMETTSIEGSAGYSEDPSLALDAFAGYKRVNISGGRDGGRAQIEQYFPNIQPVPGIDGDEIFSTGVRFVRDKRNQKENSTKGYYGRLGWSFNEGLYGSDARYQKYEAEGIHYQRLGSDRRVFVTRMYGEHNNEGNHRSVPFHQMARLGGFGSSSDASETLRAYDRGRFTDNSAILFNFEYRYTVYEYRDWKIDTVFFWDEGQVFNRFGEFQFSDFRESYGGGFRFSILNNVLLSLEVAHGDEGTQFYAKSRSPF